jgi:23S rRNA (cytidine1920-2'-O)/16S rRNA (cytidine1409-2'-O)-methyltransferase
MIIAVIMRADLLLVEQGLAPSRSAAARLIESGAVRWRTATADWQQPRKAGESLPPGCELQVTDAAEVRWASRAGLKLEGALNTLGLDPQGLIALDVGQSTGGFTDVLLARGAVRVVGVDVGHGQLSPRLRQDPRVTALEGINARELTKEDLGPDLPAQGFDLIVGDLSFISQTLVWPALVPLLSNRGQLLMLVKPQFELQPQHIGKGGLVKPDAPVDDIQRRMRTAAQSLSLRMEAWINCPVTGGDGNREHFILMRHATA